MTIKRIITSAFIGCISLYTSFAQTPVWFETDSAEAIAARINRDFPYTISEIKQKIDFLDNKTIDRYIKKGYIETRTVDGKRMVHRKAHSNVKLLAPELSGFTWRGATADAKDVQLLKDIVYTCNGDGSLTQKKRVTYLQ